MNSINDLNSKIISVPPPWKKFKSKYLLKIKFLNIIEIQVKNTNEITSNFFDKFFIINKIENVKIRENKNPSCFIHGIKLIQRKHTNKLTVFYLGKYKIFLREKWKKKIINFW